MKRPKLKPILRGFALLLVFGYAAIAIFVALQDKNPPPASASRTPVSTIAIFGASGTAGDGVLKAALADANIDTIKVITRRTTPRMEAGVQSGKVVMRKHLDYTDYSAILDELSDVQAVYWGIGLSSIGVEEDTYRRIHVEFPRAFVEQWLPISAPPEVSFHYISSSDISADSKAMWARVKVEAEKALFSLAQGSKLKVIAYRPDYIGPTSEQAHLGQRLLYWFFAPIGAAVKSTQIGQAMLETTARNTQLENGTKLSTRSIIRYSNGYEKRN